MRKGLPFVFVFILMACTSTAAPGTTCTDIQFSNNQSYPGQVIVISGLPSELFSEVYADVRTAEIEETSLGLVTVNEEGVYNLITPVHPQGISGGMVEIILHADEITCSSSELEILPLTPAPGAFLSYIENIETYLELSLDLYGIDRDLLLNGDLDQLPAILIPLATAQFLLDSPENPNSLVRIMDGTADILDETELDTELIDAMIAHLGLNDLLDEMIIEEKETLRLQNYQYQLASNSILPTNLSPSFGNIDTAQELSDAMGAQKKSMDRLTGATGKLLNDADLVSGAIGLVNPAAGGALGLALLIHKAPTEASAYLNPSSFAEIRMEVWKDSFEEDYAGEPGQIVSVWVTPRSEIWDISGLMIDVAMTGAGGIDTLSDAAKITRSGTGVIAAPGKVPANNVQTTNELLGPMTNNICARSSACSEYQPKIEINNNPWNEVKIFTKTMGDEWVDIPKKYNVLKPGDELGSYLPAAVGTEIIEIWTKSGKFGSAAARVQHTIIVHQIVVNVTPNSANLKPGETQCFNATVTHALDTGLEWFLKSQDGGYKPQGITDDILNEIEDYCFTAPDFPLDPNPDICEPPEPKTKYWNLKTVNLASTGLREGATDERFDEVVIAVRKTADNFVPPPECEEADACLLGKWVVDNQSYLAFLQAASGGGDEFTAISGQFFTEYNSEKETTSSSSGFSMTLCSSGDCLTIPIQHSGTTTFYTQDSWLYVGGGQVTAATVGGITQKAVSEADNAFYSCEGDTLSIDWGGLPTVIWNRVSD